MYNFPIGAITDSFRLPFPEAVKKAAEVGAQGIQVYTTKGVMTPEPLLLKSVARFLKSLRIQASLFLLFAVTLVTASEMQRKTFSWLKIQNVFWIWRLTLKPISLPLI